MDSAANGTGSKQHAYENDAFEPDYDIGSFHNNDSSESSPDSDNDEHTAVKSTEGGKSKTQQMNGDALHEMDEKKK